MNELRMLVGEKAMCDSLMVAEKFCKNHRDVLRSVDELIAQSCAVKSTFFESYYQARNKQKYRKYKMNRDGFSMLAMGFNGKEANYWKWQYIQAFNRMESLLLERKSLGWQENRQQGKAIRKLETDTIKKLAEYAKGQGSQHPEKLYLCYSKLAKDAAGIGKRDETDMIQISSLGLVENIIAKVIEEGMKEGKHYREIYQNCKGRLKQFQEMAYLGVRA